jgi:hypothetical protein
MAVETNLRDSENTFMALDTGTFFRTATKTAEILGRQGMSGDWEF